MNQIIHNINYPKNLKERIIVTPCSCKNQITYMYFCTLGGLSNPRCSKVEKRNGTHVYYTYHLYDVESA